MRITVFLFAAYRETVGASTVHLAVPDGTTAREVWTHLTAAYPALGRLPFPAAVAVNDTVTPQDRALADGDCVALLAPVSGGALLDLVREPIRVDAVLDAVRHSAAGAVVLLLGTVREHSRGRAVERLEYEAYDALARSEMAAIAAQAAERWGVRMAIVHRLGEVPIGEISVAIAVAAPHRRDAFDAGRFAIDTLKQRVPIWKKEVWTGGAEWIGQEEPAALPPEAPDASATC